MPLGSEKVGLMAASAAAAGAIGNYAGGIGGNTKVIDTINIGSLGNATDHGDLDVVKSANGGCDNGTNGRGILGGRASGVNQIDYWTIDTKGDAGDFGELSVARHYIGTVSNATNNRAIFGGGDGSPPYPAGYTGVMDYINVTTTMTALDFGDLSSAQRTQTSGLDNGTNDRGVWMGGWTPGTESDGITYVTITSLGNAIAFGDLQDETYSTMSASNATGDRGVSAGGWEGTPVASVSNRIDVITITSLGNAVDHGNLSVVKQMGSEGADNGVDDRATFGGGNNGATAYDVIEYIAVTGTTGASDFGDLTTVTNEMTSGCSNGAT
tara:strand:+ start:1494 stop:2468 length:975 start_codon:yes stop_codon:yes gene_type:complete